MNRMLKVSKKRILFMLILFTICSLALIAIRSYHGYKPGSSVELSDIADVELDDKGQLYVLNESGQYLYRVDSEGKINLIIKNDTNSFRSFARGTQVAVDSEGNIYVHNRIASKEAQSSIEHENIVVFNNRGMYQGTYLDMEYDKPALTPAIAELQMIDGKVYALVTNEEGISAVDVLSDDGRFYPLGNASSMVASLTYDQKNKILVASLRNGSVLKAGENGIFETIYDTPDSENDSTIWDVYVDNGTIYVADITQRKIYTIKDGIIDPFVTLSEVPYEFSVLKEGSLVLSKSAYCIECIENGEDTTVEGFSFTAGCNAFFCVVYFLFFIDGVCILYWLAVLTIFIIRNPSDKFKQIASFIAFSCVITTLFCLMLRQGLFAYMKDEMVAKITDADYLIDTLIDPEDFKAIDNSNDYYSEEYLRIKSTCESVIFDEGTTMGDIYTIIYTLERDDEVVVRYSSEEEYGCNYPYLWSDGTDERDIYNDGVLRLYDNVDETSDATGVYLDVYGPVTDENGDVIGVIEVGCDFIQFQNEIESVVRDMSINIFALVVVLLLIIFEFIEFMEGRKLKETDGSVSAEKHKVPLKVYRMAVFLVFFITNITTPFLSIYALKLSGSYADILPFSAEVLAAVPISAEVFVGAIFSLAGNKIIRKIGFRKSGILGALLFIIGLAIRFTYPDLLVLTLGNGMQGAGWGILLLIVNTKIASEPDEEKQEEGFTDYNIALQNGINSGVVAGGFLLLFMNYTKVLIITAAISVAMLLFVLKFIYDDKVEDKQEDTDKEAVGDISYIKYIFSKKVFMYFAFIVIPVIAASYYLNFLYPILADNMGMEETIIGYSYLINGLVTVCFSNIIVKFVTKHFSKKVALMLASVIYLITFVLIGVFQNIPVLMAALVLLAISDSFGYVVQETFYTELKETEAFGYDKAMGVYSLFENLAQAAGSFIFGLILAKGVGSGMIIYGAAIGILGIVFALFVEKRSKSKEGDVC